MTAWRLIARGLMHHWRIHFAVALGVMAGTAVLTGALLVGDSVRGSLRDLALERLGTVDNALVAPHFFREELATDVAALPGFHEFFSEAVPAIVLRASLARHVTVGEADEQAGTRAFSGRVTLWGVDERFWKSQAHDVARLPSAEAEIGEMLLNEPLARELGALVGDDVLLRLPEISLVPRESTLGRKSGFVEEEPMKVIGIIPAEGVGRFGLEPNQQLPLNAYAPLRVVQQMLGQRHKANAMFVLEGGKRLSDAPRAGADLVFREVRPTLADYGVRVERVRQGDREYFNLTTDRMMFEEPIERAALEALSPQGAQPALTYLANYIAAGPPLSVAQAAQLKPDDKWPNAIPYSTVTAIDFDTSALLGEWTSTLGDSRETIKRLADDEIALNSWAMDDLNRQLQDNGHPQLRPGDEIRLTYFEPEHPDGKSVERTVAFKLRAVFPLEPGHPANDRQFTPTVKGVTDRDSIANWDAPFEYHQDRIRRADDDYWRKYRATPKGFVSLRTGQRLWGTKRFGQVTSIRVPASAAASAEELADDLAERIEPAQMGFVFRPVKRQALAAATGTTPFSVLFLCFSLFIIASAVMLVAILFRLGLQRRAAEIGTLLAAGFTTRRVHRVLAAEELVVAAIGGIAGMLAGTAYAAVMLYGLRTWWVEAVATPFLKLHTSWISFAVGCASGVVVSFAAIAWTLWRMQRLAVRSLLAGQASEERVTTSIGSAPRWKSTLRWLPLGLLVLAVGLVAAASTMGGMAQAGAFFGSGFAVLAGLLAWVWGLLRSGAAGELSSASSTPLVRLAVRNGARNATRSTLTIGLVAAATFLIVALSVFQIDPSLQQPDKASGNGGFALVAESSSPIVVDLNEKRNLTGLQDAERKKLEDVAIYGLRVQPGEDASCRNLYQTARPRVLGVPAEFIERGGFAWSGSLAKTAEEQENPWRLLADVGRSDNPSYEVPIVLDANTAQWSLHLGGAFGSPLGATFEIADDWGRTIPLRVVGLLSNSIFQGDILMSEADLLRYFPGVTGKQFFLIELPAEDYSQQRAEEVRGLLETGLAESGFDAESTAERLAGFLAVQNTYLSTFQSLGALGLLLGTFGLATVQLRNVLERRSELALLRAAGFRRRRLAELVMSEHSLLLVAGLGVGTLAALAAVLPHVITSGAQVPVMSSAISLAVILVVGLAAGLFAVRATLRAPLIQALRGD